MQDIIKLLSDAIANQIAAGEVVQRPASVVKELLENAIDAKARSIQLIIKDAGRSLIQVIDDGVGMSETDARMCFERHATSKIKTADDLFRIKTMGFRGEAMASIAAVAQVELRSRRANDEIGTLIRIEGSEIKSQESVACLPSTNILVKNLFFNVPARRNFLKTNSVEMRHIIDEFQRVALAHPDIAFSLYHNDTEVYNLYSGKLIRRIIDLFGKNYRENVITCQESTPYVSVQGYVGKPDFARKTRGEQFFFVNNRFVKHNYLHHAVLTAYEGTIPSGSYPFYVLFIEIDPSHIDINIHPTKTEIKFDDERSVYAILMAVIKKSVSSNHLAGSIDFDVNADFLNPTRRNIDVPPPPATSSFGVAKSVTPDNAYLSKFDSGAAYKPSPREESNLSNWQKLFEGIENTPQPVQAELELSATAIGSPNLPKRTPEVPQNLMQVLNRYLIGTTTRGAMVIDQKAAYERILYDRYRQQLEARTGASQQLLFPIMVQLNAADVELVFEQKDSICSIGFDFDMLGNDTLVIRSFPAELPTENAQAMFEEMVEQFKIHQEAIKLDRLEATARLLSRRFSHRYLTALQPEEMQQLVTRLFESSNTNFAPGGEPIFTVLTLDKFPSLFRI